MAYSPTVWVDNSVPPINASRLNKMETGINDAHECGNIHYFPFQELQSENVQAALNELESEKIAKTILGPHSIMGAVSDDTPIAITVTDQTLVGKLTGENIGPLSATQVRSLISVAENADVTDTASVAAAGALMETTYNESYNVNSLVVAVTDDTPTTLSVGASELVGRTGAGNIDSLTAAEVRGVLSVAEDADETASVIHAATPKGTPIDADEVGLIDSGASNVLKKLTWTNIKATLKTYFDTLYIGNVSEDTTPQLGGDLDLVDYEILLDTTPGTNYTGSGIKGTFTNGNAGTVACGDVCYMALDGDLEFADADATTTMPGLYMALGTIAAAASGEWMIMGVVRNDDWDWTVGPGVSGLIYVSVTATSGQTLTQTPPSGVGDQVQIIGHALSGDVMMFNPSMILEEVS